jgi:heat shock protein HslJ
VFDPASSRWTLLPDSDQLGGWRWSWTGRRLVDTTLGAADGGDVGPYGRTIPMGGVLDPATGRWGRLPDPPAIGSGGWPVEALGGALVAAEGWVFDDRQETWTRLPRPEGAPPEPGSAVWAGELLVVLGGVDPAGGSTLEALSDGAWSWSPDAGAESPAGDVRGEWRLIELTRDGAPVPLPASAKGTLVVRAEDLGGRSFCNAFRGSYRLRGNALTIGGLGGTKMRCAPDVMAAEQAYVAALGAVDTAAVQNDELLLSGPGTELRFQRLPS